MANIFKQIFCKHDWEVINVETPIESEIVNDKYLQYKCKLGIKVFCTKCGKIDKHSTKILKQIKIKEIKTRMLCEGIEIIKHKFKNNSTNCLK